MSILSGSLRQALLYIFCQSFNHSVSFSLVYLDTVDSQKLEVYLIKSTLIWYTLDDWTLSAQKAYFTEFIILFHTKWYE